ncbi:MAG: hypothetical protein K0R65_1719 [Crocinitomicaceae bacterium]|jgi:hypothetical protein|nr:hypothetical protein [Crocinitomicaceae bacterium]
MKKYYSQHNKFKVKVSFLQLPGEMDKREPKENKNEKKQFLPDIIADPFLL